MRAFVLQKGRWFRWRALRRQAHPLHRGFCRVQLYGVGARTLQAPSSLPPAVGLVTHCFGAACTQCRAPLYGAQSEDPDKPYKTYAGMNQALVQMHKRYIDQSSEEATAVTDLVAFADGITWEVCVTRDVLYCGPHSVLFWPRSVLLYAWPAARWHCVGPRVHGRTLRTLPDQSPQGKCIVIVACV